VDVMRDQMRKFFMVVVLSFRNSEKLQAIASVVSQAEEEAQAAEASAEKS